MAGLSEGEGAPGRLDYTDGRLAELEAENARLRAALAQQEALVGQPEGSALLESQIRLVADALPVLISYVDAEQRYRYNNKAYEVWFGYPRRNLLGRHLRDALGDEAYARARPMVETALAGRNVSADTNLADGHGVLRHVHLEFVPDRRSDGSVAGYFALIQDVTESKRVEHVLRDSEARFRAMADCAPAPVWVTNADGIEFANRAFLEVSGLAAEALTGDVWTRIIHPDDLAPVLELRTGAWKAKEAYSYDARFRRADGEWRWMHVSCNPRLDDGGGLTGYVGIAVDLTEQKRAEAELRESEARFRAMADSAPAPVWVTNEKGIEFANRGLCAFTGLSVAELVGDTWMSLAHPEDLDGVAKIRDEAWRTHSPYEFEARFRRHDGEWRWLRASCAPRETKGDFLGYVGLAVDVTESRRAEAELRESEDRFRTLAENIPTLCWMADEAGWIFWYNRRWYEYTGTTPAEMEGWGWQSVHDPEVLPSVVERWKSSIATGESFEMVFPLRGADGSYRPFLTRVDPLRDEHGRIVRWFGSNTDIAGEKQLEAALRAESRILGTVNQVGAALSGELDLERLVQLVTDAGVELTGAEVGAFFYNVVDAAGESYMLYSLAGVDRSAFEAFPMPRNTGVFAPTFTGECVVRSDDITSDPRYGHNPPYRGMPEGHLPVTSYLAAPVTGRSGEVIGGLFFGHSEPGRFTERHEQLLVGIAGQAAVAIDNARLFEAAQREIAERTRAEEALRELNQSLEHRIAAAVEERRRAEEALRQAQKMEAVGQLTGGIAHDFNNLLTVIGGNLDMAARRLGGSGDPRIQRAIANAMTGAHRAATLTQRLLAFSRRQPLAPKAIDPSSLLAGMSDLLHRTLGETIEIETRLTAGVWRIEADPHQLESAILNLAVNARDAMPEGGRLVIETATVRLEADEPWASDEISPGHYVALSVSDTGCGMNEDTLRRAVEPFFTTKDVGKGTGLGLSMVYGFVRQSGGHLRIESEEGRGSRIHIFLPRMAAESLEEEQAVAATAPRGAGEETVLVCEDDDDVRAYTTELLQELGYRVLEAQDGPSTMRLLEDGDNRVDLLFTDVVLPGGTSGAELAQQARAVRPELRVLFTTGYARDAIVHEGRLDPGIELVTKPFSFVELAARVREVLDRR